MATTAFEVTAFDTIPGCFGENCDCKLRQNDGTSTSAMRSLAVAFIALAGCGQTDRPPAFPLTSEVAGVPAEVATFQDDWPLPNRDYDNTRATFTASINAKNVAGLKEAWRLSLTPASSPFGTMTSNPLILGDAVYLQDMSSHVYCLDRETGAVRWKFTHGEPSVGPNGVAVGWGRVFANSGDTGVMAVDASDGRELWRWKPALTSSEGIDIQPTAYDGSVFVSTVPASLRGGYLGGSRGIIHALDPITGKSQWSFDTVDSEDIWGSSADNSGGGAWYPPLIDPARKRTYWGTGNPGPCPGLPDAPSGVGRPGPNLYTSSLVALDADSGKLAWYHQEQPHDLYDWDFQGSPMRVGETADHPELIVGSGKTGTVVALDADSGKLVWRSEVGRHENDHLTELPVSESIMIYPGALGGVLTPTAYADDTLYVPIVDMGFAFTGSSFDPDVLTASGALVALDVATGAQRWSAPLPAPSYGAATVVNDLVFTSDANGRVYAFARADGHEVWHFDAGGGINAPLAAAGDLLLVSVGLDNPAVIALRL
jgi:glucose dehydrogenase